MSWRTTEELLIAIMRHKATDIPVAIVIDWGMTNARRCAFAARALQCCVS
jgi:hypothetical protein